jgi:hypothetical protein
MECVKIVSSMSSVQKLICVSNLLRQPFMLKNNTFYLPRKLPIELSRKYAKLFSLEKIKIIYEAAKCYLSLIVQYDSIFVSDSARLRREAELVESIVRPVE